MFRSDVRGTFDGQNVIKKVTKRGVEESPIDENGGGGSNISCRLSSVFFIISNVIIIVTVVIIISIVFRWFRLKLPLLWSPQESKT